VEYGSGTFSVLIRLISRCVSCLSVSHFHFSVASHLALHTFRPETKPGNLDSTFKPSDILVDGNAVRLIDSFLRGQFTIMGWSLSAGLKDDMQ